jgi:hypothetical protein
MKLDAPIPPRAALGVEFFAVPSDFDPRTIELLVNSKDGPAQVLSGSRGGSW